MQPSVPILAQARGSVLRRTTGPKDGVHNYSETYPCDTCGISATVGRALCVPLHPDLHAKTGARQAVSAQVSKPSSPRGRGLSPVSPAPASLGGAAAAQLQAPARQAQASNQRSILMQLNRFACMPSFMRRPSWRLLHRHTPCTSIASALAALRPRPCAARRPALTGPCARPSTQRRAPSVSRSRGKGHPRRIARSPPVRCHACAP